MKKYGMAELMIAVVQAYLMTHFQNVSEEQRREIEERCSAEILMRYPTTRELEVER